MCYDLQQRNRDFLSDLLSLLHPRDRTWRPMATIAVHIDESGTTTSKWCIVAGHLGTASDWGQFTDDWNAVRNRPEYGGVVVHCSDILAGRKGFKDWDGLKRYRFILQLVQVIERWRDRIFGFAVAIPVDEFARIVGPTLRPQLKDPYYTALGLVLTRVLEMSDAKFDASMVTCISDQRDDGSKKRGQAIYSAIRESLGEQKHRLDEEIIYRSKELVIPLQAADVLANCAFRDLTHGPDGDLASVLIRGELNVKLNRCFVEQPVCIDSGAMHVLAGGRILS